MIVHKRAEEDQVVHTSDSCKIKTEIALLVFEAFQVITVVFSCLTEDKHSSVFYPLHQSTVFLPIRVSSPIAAPPLQKKL